MAKKAKKKKIKDRLARKRGRRKKKRKKQKKKTPPPSSKNNINAERLNKMMLSTIPLSELEELRDIEFDKKKMDDFLKSAKKAPKQEPIEFIRSGIRRVMTQNILEKINKRFLKIYNQDETPKYILQALDSYYKLSQMGITPEYIPAFILFFIMQAKNRPLADDPKIWKYIMDFLPKKIVSPENQQTIVTPDGEKKEKPEEKPKKEKRDEKYPHIIIPE